MRRGGDDVRAGWRRFAPPLVASLRGYRLGWLRGDLSAGLAIAAVGIPSAIAYPALAGLPPQTGLYASIAPLIAYALFGPSRQLIVGPDAATMTVLAAVLATSGQEDPVAAAATLAIAVGGLCLGARLLRLGVLASFLSRPILVGFFAGVALSILVGQLGRMTGTEIEADGLLRTLLEFAREAGATHWPSLALALGMLAVLWGAERLRSPVPGPVLVVALAVALSAALDLEGRGVAVVGELPAGLPALTAPSLTALPLDRLLLGAGAVFLVSFGAGIVTARSFGDRGGYPVDPNRELTGFGAANIAAGLVGAFPVTASDSRTAINALIGGKTQIAQLIAALALLATLLYLRDALAILPIPALAAILVMAALEIIDLGELRRLWRISRMELLFALIALVGAAGLGVLWGVLTAIAATLAYLLHNMMFPRDALLGRVPGHDAFYKLHRTPAAQPIPGLTVCLIEGNLLFFAADHVKRRLEAIADDLGEGARWLVIDASAIVQVDSTGADMLEEVRAMLAERGVTLGLAELHTGPHRLLERAGVMARIGPEMVFHDLDAMLEAWEATAPDAAGPVRP